MGFRHFALSCTLAASLILIACSQDEPASTSNPPVADSAWDEALADRARLIDVLPETTLAYIRIPSLWGLISAPKPGALAPALGSEANRAVVEQLQHRVPEAMAIEFGALAPAMTLILDTLASPLEIAMVGDGPQPLEADLVIEARLDLTSTEEFNTLLTNLTGSEGVLRILEPATDEEPGQLLAGLFPIFYGFDAETQRVRLVGGMSAQVESYLESLEWDGAGDSRLRQMHERIDASGFGLMVWADGERLAPVLEQSLPPEQAAEIRDLGLLATDELAYGYGSSNGKARLSLIARGEGGPLWQFGLPEPGTSDFEANGEPDYAAGLLLPDSAWVERTWQALDPDAESNRAEIDQKLMELSGARLADWIDALAGRWLLLNDANGGYLVHEPARADAWGALLDRLATKFDIVRDAQTHRGQAVHRLSIPGMSLPIDLPEAQDPGQQAGQWIVQRLMAIGTHVYWLEEDGRRILANVPQILHDRLAYPGDTSVGDWLARAGLNPGQATLFGAVRADGAPQRNYYAYLSTLQALGDMLDTQVDLSPFPSARSLELADAGTVGLELSYTEQTIELGLAFENHPGDLFYSGGGGMAGIAVAGMLAAIAIPAYQDYTKRAMSSEFLNMAASAKLAIAEFYVSEGRLPNEEEAASFSQVFDSGPVRRIDYNARLLRLVIQLGPEAGFGDNASLELVPVLQNGMVVRWRCASTSIEDTALPAQCRP
ncbi:pilin [Wenzhouxiangella marina]|uniref:Uncharacterized protein n=1 Tax=Wenzhouxiangella marina TaxID=1579979 RepID=A0A0K0XT92_9GAMM|nr:pilin [Wenzhouxiangella marina]AKS40842.1 hypothetical protein WM2015_460 [Wenzhouxiangella marina]MBB6087716.1 hypothetical protein [Wenzhouxiangella marina]